MNHYLTTKYGKEIVLPPELMEMALANLSISENDLVKKDGEKISLRTDYQESIKENVKEAFEQASEEWARKYTSMTLHEQQIDRLFAAVTVFEEPHF